MKSTSLILLLLAVGCDAGTIPTTTRTFALDAGAGDMPPNEPPVAVDDAVTVDEDDSLLIDVLANDSDPDGDALTVYLVDAGSEGAVTREGDAFRYEPRPNFHGEDSFTYGVLDGFGGDAVATVTITVDAVNDAPQFANPTPPQFATLSVGAGEVLEFPLAASDVDDDELTFGYEPFPTESDPPLIQDGVFRWSPTRNDVGTIPLVVWVDDGTERAERELTIDVAPPGDVMCGQYRCDGDDVCFDETCFTACAQAADCGGDAACFDGRCAVTACEGRRCPDGESCRQGGCYRICESDAQCAPGQRCFEDRCAETSCEGVVCATDEVCIGGSCRLSCASADECGELGCFAGGCAVDVCDGVVCPSGQLCENGSCAADCTDGQCEDEVPVFEAGGCGCSSARADVSWLLIPLLLLAGFVSRRGRRVAHGGARGRGTPRGPRVR